MTRLAESLLVPVTVALVLSLVACGGGSDEDDVRAASEDFVAAFKDENWSEVCTLMTKQSKAQLEQAGELVQADGGCEDVLKKVATRIPPATKQELEDFEIDTVKVNGNTATVTSTSAKGAPAQLRKEDGEWKVNFGQ